MFYVNHRWLGGTLTNWVTLQKSIKRLKLLKAMVEDGRMARIFEKGRGPPREGVEAVYSRIFPVWRIWPPLPM